MRKKRKIASALLALTMGFSLFATAAYGEVTDSKETYRVIIKGPSSEKAKAKETTGVRWDFGSDGYSTTVNAKQYQALLKNKNLSIEKVPEVQLIELKALQKIKSVQQLLLPCQVTVRHGECKLFTMILTLQVHLAELELK